MKTVILVGLLVGIAGATSYNGGQPASRPIIFAPPKPIGHSVRAKPFYGGGRDHLACCANFDHVLSELEDQIDDTKDDSKDLEKKIHRLSRQLYRLKKTQFSDWTTFTKESETLTSKPAGLPGPKGSDGAPGAHGAQGPTGPEGPQGEKGEAGNDIIGINGRDGDDGLPGERGLRGLEGAVGPVVGKTPGRRGEKGHPGRPGGPGASGDEGPAGNTGLKGKKGDKGLHGRPIDCDKRCQNGPSPNPAGKSGKGGKGGDKSGEKELKKWCRQNNCYDSTLYFQPANRLVNRRQCWREGCFDNGLHDAMTDPGTGEQDTRPVDLSSK